jgi:hypothetical protein
VEESYEEDIAFCSLSSGIVLRARRAG